MRFDASGVREELELELDDSGREANNLLPVDRWNIRAIRTSGVATLSLTLEIHKRLIGVPSRGTFLNLGCFIQRRGNTIHMTGPHFKVNS